MTTTIYKLTQHGDRMVDVSHSEGITRVALDWDDFCGDLTTINAHGLEKIEAKVKAANSADEIEWRD